MRPQDSNRPWHSLDAQTVVEQMKSRDSGLTSEEASERLETYGPNTIQEGVKVSPLKVLIDQFTSPLIYVLLASFVVTAALQRWSDASVIGLVLIVNATVGFLQEFRAENAIRALVEMVSPKARVRRDNEAREVNSDRIVPGDVVLLSEGDVVPADVRLIDSRSLQVNEAALTGESVPASKSPKTMEDADEDLPPAEIDNMIYMGTAVTSGHGEGVVVATAANTQVGEIAESIRSAETKKTPIQRRMDRLAKALAVGIVLVAAVAFAVGLLMGESVEDMFLLAVALAVAAMPAGLPVVMTVALAVGVRRMAQRHAVIRHLPAVETLGSCTVIVSDKTGTLTRNQMTVREIAIGDERLHVTGASLQPTGRIERDDTTIEIENGSALYTTLLAGMLNNEATVREREERQNKANGRSNSNQSTGGREPDAPTLQVSGDPMEAALLIAGLKAGLNRDDLLEQYEQVDEVPFQTERRFSASIHKDPSGDGPLVCVKGAPEVILDMCDDRLDEDGQKTHLDKTATRKTMDDMAASGLRLLAMAVGRGNDAVDRIKDGAPTGFTFAGIQGLLDPPRDSAIQAVDDCHRAGIRVVMVSGDHARTAAAIGRQVHLDRPAYALRVRDEFSVNETTSQVHDETSGDESELTAGELPEARVGREFAKLSDEELDDTLNRVNVFARLKPDQKLKLVRRLRDNGEIVAVTGDGVNDAPALKEADLGAAMGQTGTDVAKEASDMVITDDNLASVYAAVEEGRTAFRNIRMATFFLLSTGAADVLIILTALGLTWPLPLLPAQILWCNVVTNGIADVALGFEPGEPALYHRPPRPPSEGVLDRVLLERLVLVGFWLATGVLAVFLYKWGFDFKSWDGQEENLALARTAALTTLVLFQKVHVFNCRSEDVSIFRKSLFSNKVLFIGVMSSLAVHIAAIYIPFTQEILSLAPLDATTWLIAALVASTAIIVNELHKKYRPR